MSSLISLWQSNLYFQRFNFHKDKYLKHQLDLDSRLLENYWNWSENKIFLSYNFYSLFWDNQSIDEQLPTIPFDFLPSISDSFDIRTPFFLEKNRLFRRYIIYYINEITQRNYVGRNGFSFWKGSRTKNIDGASSRLCSWCGICMLVIYSLWSDHLMLVAKFSVKFRS